MAPIRPARHEKHRQVERERDTKKRVARRATDRVTGQRREAPRRRLSEVWVLPSLEPTSRRPAPQAVGPARAHLRAVAVEDNYEPSRRPPCRGGADPREGKGR
mmetsp:Transcript_22815/g.59604  ORF Transcript_22815/g.59604 Transcript_22815/m.59604 type:complete len:103 (+) Transcript_22815:799-1107(+)